MILEIQEIDYAYKKKKVLDGMSLTIAEPGIYGLVGPNGTGKTTLMSVVANLFSAQKGSIEILGMDHTDKNVWKEMAYLQDNSVLYDYLSGYQHLQFVCDMHGIPYAKIAEVIESLGMETYIKDKVRGYSLGMKQRLLLAIAMLPDPAFLMLDEPLNGLDPTSTIIVRETLQRLEKEGKTILVSSHNLTELDRVTDHIFFLVNGKAKKENLADYRTETLFLKPEDKVASKQFLMDAGITHAAGEDWFRIPCLSHTAIELLERFFQQGLKIKDFRKETTGSETRYRELFEGVVE